MQPPIGLYVHFPWCRRRCPYCDFAIAVAPLGEIPHERYADVVLEELVARAPRFPGRTLRSIYFGGGTPALWEPRQIARVIAGARRLFDGDPEEITVEANPNDCVPRALAALREAGVDRLSIGAQEFDRAALVQLGRDHDERDSLAALPAARDQGFDNVSLDLICALPGRELVAWERTLARAIELSPEHLSVYQLTVEPRTTFGEAARRGTLSPTPDEESAAQLEAAHARLTAAGYEHYEVSSYARPGRRSRHNGLYWSGGEYLGIGNGAHSLLRDERGGALRWSNHRSVVRYLDAAPEWIAETVEQDARDFARDLLWTGLRTSDGVDRALVGSSPGLERLVAAGLLAVDAARVRPTARGLLFADETAATLLNEVA